jgi:hypothetical protein
LEGCREADYASYSKRLGAFLRSLKRETIPANEASWARVPQLHADDLRRAIPELLA